MIAIAAAQPALTQDSGFVLDERCAGLPSVVPDAPFDGMLVTVEEDAARAYRDGVATTYVLSFGGGNFLAAGAVSPDGAHYAVPNGIITTVANSDVRYTVQEIRVLTTGTVPRIVERVPWRASFPVGTAFTSDGDIPPIRWLDALTVQFVSGTMSEGHTLVSVDVFAGDQPQPAAGLGLAFLSPDGTRGVGTADGVRSLIDTARGGIVAALPQTPHGAFQLAWSPDGARFAMTDIADESIALRLYDADGAREETVLVLPPEQVLWNLRWSPDGARLAFSAFDPQTMENRLHVADLDARTVTDTCLPLLADVDGKNLSALAWSPDGSRLALMTDQTSPGAAVQIYDVEARSRFTLVPAAGRFLGWYP